MVDHIWTLDPNGMLHLPGVPSRKLWPARSHHGKAVFFILLNTEVIKSGSHFLGAFTLAFLSSWNALPPESSTTWTSPLRPSSCSDVSFAFLPRPSNGTVSWPSRPPYFHSLIISFYSVLLDDTFVLWKPLWENSCTLPVFCTMFLVEYYSAHGRWLGFVAG